MTSNPSIDGGRSPRPLRVCHLGKFYPPASGGVETHVQALARAQARLGAEVHVLCVNHADDAGHDVLWSHWARTNSRVDADGAVRIVRMGRHASVARLDLCPAMPSAFADLANANLDVVHLHAPNPTMSLALAAYPLPGALVVTHHGDIVSQRVLGIAFRPVENLIYSRAVQVFATTEEYRAGSPLLRRFASKIVVLPLGIDLGPMLAPSSEALAHERKLRAELRGPIWLTVGRLVYYKGLHVAVRALRDAPGTLLVIGSGPLEGDLRRQAASVGVADRIVWAGKASTDELLGAYRAATALWFPSNARSEAFGLVQVEAMASGCPVINTRIPGSGVAWVSLHDQTGLTVPMEDATALAAAARRIAADPELRARLSRGAIARTRAEFDELLMAERSLSSYRRVLGQTSTAVDGARQSTHEVGLT